MTVKGIVFENLNDANNYIKQLEDAVEFFTQQMDFCEKIEEKQRKIIDIFMTRLVNDNQTPEEQIESNNQILLLIQELKTLTKYRTELNEKY